MPVSDKQNRMPQNGRNQAWRLVGRTLATFWYIHTFFPFVPVLRRNICNNFASSVKVGIFFNKSCRICFCFCSKNCEYTLCLYAHKTLYHCVKIPNLRIASRVGARSLLSFTLCQSAFTKYFAQSRINAKENPTLKYFAA